MAGELTAHAWTETYLAIKKKTHFHLISYFKNDWNDKRSKTEIHQVGKKKIVVELASETKTFYQLHAFKTNDF